MNYAFKKVTALAGGAGSGKTTVAVNLAKSLPGSVVIDLDTVNPYFRAKDFAANVEVVAAEMSASNLDLPVIDFPLAETVAASERVIIDLGAGAQGAAVLGRFRRDLENSGFLPDLLFVFNAFRGLSAQDTAAELFAVEAASGIKCRALVNNSNLAGQASDEMLDFGLKFQKELEAKTRLKTAFSCTPNNLCRKESLAITHLVKLPWEE
jgi:hypothetical protein